MSKILEINTVADHTNAVGRLMMSLTDHLRSRGHTCYVATGRGDFSNVDFKIGNKLNVYSHAFWSRITDTEGLHSRQATKRLVDYIHRVEPDVVHLHNLHGHYLNIRLLIEALARWGGRVVLTMHDLWWLTGHCTHFAHNDCAPWLDNCRNCNWHRREYPTSWLDSAPSNLERKRRLLHQLPDLSIVVPSHWMHTQLLRGHLADIRSQVIANGIDTQTFHPAEVESRQGILCVASRWSRSKVIEYIVNLSHLTDLPITVVGDIMGQHIDTRRILVIPHATPSELASLYQQSAVVVNPSQVESYGMVTAEALSCGTPVVVNAHCGAAVELLSRGGGLAVEPEQLHEGVARIVRGDYPALKTPPPHHQSNDRCLRAHSHQPSVTGDGKQYAERAESL